MSARMNIILALALSSSALVSITSAHAQSLGGSIVEAPQPVIRSQQAQPVAAPARVESPAQAAVKPGSAANLAVEQDVDESALRYYAGLNQTARVKVETQRLQRLYPHWRVPDDLYAGSGAGSADEEPLWDLFSNDRIEDLRLAITQRMQSENGWTPSKDLVRKMRRKELRLKIMTYWKDGQLDKLIDFVKADPLTADNADVDILWTIAEAYARTKQTADAVSIYTAILQGENNSEQRIATIQKAMANMRMMDVETLIALGRTNGEGRNEFDAISIDITRGRISAFLHDEPAKELNQLEFQNFQDYARKDTDANQSGLVAWYFYKRKDFTNALEWFKFSLEKNGDAMIAHGLAHSLRELQMFREAEEVAFAWREPLINNQILFIDILERDLTKEIPPYIEPERLARYGQVTMELASGEGAQALGWYAYNSCQFEVAQQWFQRAVAWFPKEATTYGYTLTLRRLKQAAKVNEKLKESKEQKEQREARDNKDWLEVANRYDGLFPKVIDLVFPDGMYHPPTPCDLTNPTQAQMQPNGQLGYPMAQQAPIQQFPQPFQVQQNPQGVVNDPMRQYSWGKVPMPGQQAMGQQPQQPVYGPNGQIIGSKPVEINRSQFPIGVTPENPLRFAATNIVQGAAAHTTMQPFPPTPGYSREPFTGPWPLVARRVPGVGPMPYERYGYALLPGWNGQATHSWPPASAQIAPAGTLWSTDQTERPKTAIQQSSRLDLIR